MTKERILAIGKVLLGIFCLGLIIYGQRKIGVTGLSLMLIGLGGLLGLLFNYNQQYT